MLLPVLVGAALGAMVALLARTRQGGETPLLAMGLVAAAMVYVAFAVPAADPRWLFIEGAGVAVFGVLAWLGRTSAGWLALGWTVHVAWDVGLHMDRTQPVVGAWYPLLCVGFDLIVAGFLLRAATVIAGSRAEAA